MKTQKSESVLQDWVHELTFQQQALLLTGVRGPDGIGKNCHAKRIVRYLRGAVIKSANKDYNHDTNNNSFIWGEYFAIGNPPINVFQGWAKYLLLSHDDVPHHFLMHLIHSAEVIGYKHPTDYIRHSFLWLYEEFCKSFHMTPETELEMDKRLNDFK